jgi:hypothetical protein
MQDLKIEGRTLATTVETTIQTYISRSKCGWPKDQSTIRAFLHVLHAMDQSQRESLRVIYQASFYN